MSHDDSALVVEGALQLHDEVVAKLFPSTEHVYIRSTCLCMLVQMVKWRRGGGEREREREERREKRGRERERAAVGCNEAGAG